MMPTNYVATRRSSPKTTTSPRPRGQDGIHQPESKILGKLQSLSLKWIVFGKIPLLNPCWPSGLPLRWLLLPSTFCKRRRSGAWSESMVFQWLATWVGATWRKLSGIRHSGIPLFSQRFIRSRWYKISSMAQVFAQVPTQPSKFKENLTGKQWRSRSCLKKTVVTPHVTWDPVLIIWYTYANDFANYNVNQTAKALLPPHPPLLQRQLLVPNPPPAPITSQVA